MNSFVKNTLKLDNTITISNASVSVIKSKLGNNANKLYKLKGSLVDSSDWSSIFSRIRNLKDTNLFLDKCHTPEVKQVLSDFRKTVFTERQNNKNAYIKNLTIVLDEQSYDVFSVLKSRFARST
jgi:hypothetical protein